MSDLENQLQETIKLLESFPQARLNRLKVELRKLERKIEPTLRRKIRGASLTDAISLIESSLNEIPQTPFHALIGRSYQGQKESLSTYLVQFFRFVSPNFVPKAIYLELNALSLNPDDWHVDAFAYKKHRSINRSSEWLSSWDSLDFPPHRLEGLLEIQQLFQRPFYRYTTPIEERLARVISEFLVTLRFSELVAEAHKLAKLDEAKLGDVVVLSDAHDYELLYQSR